MDKNSNTYQILYAAIMVVVVGAVLALVYTTLKPQQDLNRDNDTRKQILAAIMVVSDNDKAVEANFNKHIIGQYLVNTDGEVVDSSSNVAFEVDMAKNIKEPEPKLPVFKAKATDGTIKYIIPVYGAGLWGPIWGYIALNGDGTTIYGTNFSHQGETPGLGARITEQPFQASFEDKHIFIEGNYKCVEVVKKGGKSLSGAETVDAISGATITSRGVSDMINNCLEPYQQFLKKLN